MNPEIPTETVNFLDKHQGSFVTAFLGLAAWLFLRWANSRRPRVSARAKKLLNQLRADTTHEVKGITLHRFDGKVNYWPFRLLEGDKVELGMFYELSGEYLEVVLGVEELVSQGYLTVEQSETEASPAVYRLNP